MAHEYSEPGEYGVLLRVWDDDPYPYRASHDDWITVWVVDVDVFAGLTEQAEENPGLYINVNWGDDDLDGWMPSEDPPDATYKADKDDDEIGLGGDNDFRVFTIHVDPQQAPVTVVVQFPNKIKVWRTFTKKMEGGGTSEVVSGTAYDPQNIPGPLLIEGQLGTENFRDVSLTATVKYGQNEICSDTVKITVFEVTLAGLFNGPQKDDCEVKMSDDTRFLFTLSSDTKGKISWDDKDGDGVAEGEGDYDTNCEYFHDCMECQGTVKPSGVTAAQAEFKFERERAGKAWKIPVGKSEWELAGEDAPWQNDNWEDDEDQDKSPSQGEPPDRDHIYQIDGPGFEMRTQAQVTNFAYVLDLRQRVLVRFAGQAKWYQCSGFYKWHSQMYLKPKDELWLTRDAPAKQKLGGGWINIPANP